MNPSKPDNFELPKGKIKKLLINTQMLTKDDPFRLDNFKKFKDILFDNMLNEKKEIKILSKEQKDKFYKEIKGTGYEKTDFRIINNFIVQYKVLFDKEKKKKDNKRNFPIKFILPENLEIVNKISNQIKDIENAILNEAFLKQYEISPMSKKRNIMIKLRK